MKKYIFIIMILMGIINFGNENYGYVRSSMHNDSVYCIGIGKLTENINDRILSFKACVSLIFVKCSMRIRCKLIKAKAP